MHVINTHVYIHINMYMLADLVLRWFPLQRLNRFNNFRPTLLSPCLMTFFLSCTQLLLERNEVQLVTVRNAGLIFQNF